MGLLACQRDAKIRMFEAAVLDCRPAGEGFDVVLSDTILYPEGGGQPADHGTIAGVAVVDVQRVDGEILHRAVAPVALGPAMVEVDWSRRFDHMQQHTAQHLITALAQDRFGWATTSFHLRSGPCDIELDTERVSEEALVELEELVNAVIRAGRPVSAREVDVSALESLGVRTRGLPAGLTGPVRLVGIEGIDLNTCGGTHVGNTAELESVKLLKTESVSRGTRLFFLAGGRVRRALGEALETHQQVGAVLSASASGLVSAVTRLADESKARAKLVGALHRELATHIGAQLAASDEAVLTLHRPDGDLPFLDSVTRAARRQGSNQWVLLTAGLGEEGVFLVEGPPERVAELRAEILETLAARGGGRPGRLQGKASRLSARGRVADRLRAEVE